MLTFLKFCEKINVKLTPAQRVYAAVAYDGVEPAWLKNARDRELARQIFGDVEVFPEGIRKVAVALCGARSGKSYVFTALRILHLALTVNLEPSGEFLGLGPNERAYGLLVAPDLKLASQTYRFILGAAQHPYVAGRIVGKPNKESFILARENGREVEILCLPATTKASAIRGRYYLAAGLEEFAFFRSEDYQVNDTEVFRAVSPRMIPGGQIIIPSTAWMREGAMYEFVTDNWGHPSYALAAIAPTSLMNPSKIVEVEEARERDPENAAREFDCVFMSTSANKFFSFDAIEAAVDPTLTLPLRPPPGCEIMIGADLGFRRDNSALVVVYKLPDGIYVVADIVELSPSPGKPLKPSDVIGTFAATCIKHECTWLMADGHYRETLEEELSKHKLSYVEAPAGVEGKVTSHMHAKALLNSGKIKIPNHKRLINQMKALVSKPNAGGGVSLISPRPPKRADGTPGEVSGGHGDILSAWVLAVSQRAGQKGQETIPDRPKTLDEVIKAQTALVWERYEERRLEALANQAEAEQDWSKGPWG